jgi:hypothetical protein
MRQTSPPWHIAMPSGGGIHSISAVWLGPAFAQIGRDHRPEMIDPAPNRLVRDQNPTLRQQIFHIAKTECEPKIQPYSLVYDLRREPVAGVADFLHSFRYRTARATASPTARDNSRAAGVKAQTYVIIWADSSNPI